MVVADSLNGGTYDYGLGENVLGTYGDTPGPGNVHNRGGFASVVFSRDGKEAPGAGARGWWPEGMLHEITHNLGGVQWSAPHSTQPVGLQDPRYGHCWQGYDVMCYLEDAGAAHAMRNDCPRIGGAIPQTYDCGHDDYFNPSPAAGSYLATHWNVYDNDFLAPCADIMPACGGGMAGLVPEPPVATSGPQVIGMPRRGAVDHRGRRQLAATGRSPTRSAGSACAAATGRTSPARRARRTGPRRPTAAGACACRSSPPTRTAGRPRLHRRRPAWPTGRSATLSRSRAVSAAWLRAELVRLLPGAAVVELERRLGREPGRSDFVHPPRLAPRRRIG